MTNPAPVPPRLISARDLSRMVNEPKRTLLRWARDRWIPSHVIGKRVVRFNEHEVIAAIEKMRRK